MDWDPIGGVLNLDPFWGTDTGSLLVPAQRGDINPEVAKIAIRFKKEYSTIYLLRIAEEIVVIVRPLTKNEWDTFVKLRHIIPNLDRADVLGDALLWPKQLLTDPNIPAGWPEAVFDSIEDLTGFGDTDNLIHVYRDFRSELDGEKADLDSQIKMLLPAAFRNLLPHEVGNWDIISLAEGLAIVEKYLKTDLELKTSAELEKEKTKGGKIANRVHTQEELKKMREVL